MIPNKFTAHIPYMCTQVASRVWGKAKMVKTDRGGEAQKAAEKSKGASEDKKREDEQQKDGINSKQLSKKGRKRKHKEL